ncbi:MAG: hypothetical protein ACXABJ_06845, partial [Candidatus Heimdallarchaeaceae archaeon]
MNIMINQNVILPIGCCNNGQIHKNVTLTHIDGSIEEKLLYSTQTPAHKITQLLCNCIKQIESINNITPEIVRDLSILDRNFLIIKLREMTFSQRFDCLVKCPDKDCDTEISIDFSTNDLISNG